MNQQVIQFVGSGRQSNSSEVMTSLEVASVCGKHHSDILKAIRKMEPAWEKVAQGKFSLGSYKGVNESNFGLVDYKDKKGEVRPMYELTPKGCAEFSADPMFEETEYMGINSLQIAEVAERNFALNEYKDANGENSPYLTSRGKYHAGTWMRQCQC